MKRRLKTVKLNNMTYLSYLTGAVSPQTRSKLYWLLSDSLIFIKRSLKHIRKNPDQLIGLITQPIMFMLLFRYVFGGAIDPGNTTYVNFLIAGILVQTSAFGASTTSFSVAVDMQRGIIDRIKSLPIASTSLLLGHVTADLVRNVISGLIMILVALVVGFRPEASATDWLAITGLLLLFTFAVSWMSAVLGLIAKTIEAVQWISFLLIFPLTFASAAFAPTDTMAPGLRWFAENQPVTHVIEAIRALMLDMPVGNHITLAVIWFVAIIFISVPLATYLYRQHSGR